MWLQNAGKFSENVFSLVQNVREALGCTHTPVQWEQWAVSPGLKLISHIHVELRLRIIGAVSPLPHMPAWCDFTLLLPDMFINY